jgi:hypothetical protein
MREIHSVRDLVLLWGDPPAAYEQMAADLGVNWHVPRDWARRNRIPAQRIDSIVNAARNRGFRCITHEFMAKLLARCAEERAA